jgi:predicted nucleotidyltransferase
MISADDRKKIAVIAARYAAKRVLLFGSSASDTESEPRDIDVAVEGVDPSQFFSFYGDLIFALSKPVDLVDLETRSKFTELISREGVPVYG